MQMFLLKKIVEKKYMKRFFLIIKGIETFQIPKAVH